MATDALDEKYAKLFALAAKALKEEDALLRDRFAEARRKRDAYSNVAHGLTYWLFETTLVYTIFKNWIVKVPVAWEHATVERRARQPVAKGSKPKCDLVVFSDWSKGAPVEAAIEAKWWNDKGSKGGGVLSDVKKLRSRFSDPVRRYILTFWCGTASTFDRDLGDAETFCSREKLLLVGDVRKTRIATRLIGGERGYFSVAGIRC